MGSDAAHAPPSQQYAVDQEVRAQIAPEEGSDHVEPAAPTNRRILSFTSSSVRIGWDALTDPSREGFRLYATGNKVLTEVPTGNRQKTIKGLSQGKTYHFTVRAFQEHMETQANLCPVAVNLPAPP